MSKNNINHKIVIERPGYNENLLTERYSFQKYKSENALKSTGNYIKKYYKPSRHCMQRFLFNRLPLIQWIKAYSIKENLIKDIVGGLTIGVVQIPQSMGYSLMAGLPPVCGLYVSFFTVILYFIFGTSRHLSMGKFNSFLIFYVLFKHTHFKRYIWHRCFDGKLCDR